MTAALLDIADVRKRIEDRRAAETQAEIDYIDKHYRHIKPLSVAADGLIDYAQNPHGRFMLGLHDLDIMMRGIGRRELAYITGQSHQGKTQLVLNAIAHNHDRRILYFTPDEVAELVLAKLVAIRYGVDSEQLEARIKINDAEMIDLVQGAATKDFRQTIVIDDSLTMNQMMDALREAEDYWREPCDLVVIDFLELLPGTDVDAKSQALKRWCKDANVPVICLHQGKKDEGTRGRSGGFFGARYGGQNEAIFLGEVYRKRDDASATEYDRRRHANTVTVQLLKNKRPPSKTGTVDFYLDPRTGLIRPLRSEDLAVSTSNALTAVKTIR
jgi:replicative DNA helicase